ncbi:hypothetical protein WAK64_00950 [Bacillus spongiae]|uniref:Uncharacterized protein n=1 Tax=Bacillus spongiae TaxID=2683610 RepID=A0ABU8H8Q8_9BACI
MRNFIFCCFASALAILVLILFPIGIGKIAESVFSVEVLLQTSPPLLAATIIIADIVLVLIVVLVFLIALVFSRRLKFDACCLAASIALFTLLLFPIGMSTLLDAGIRALVQIDMGLSSIVNIVTIITIIVIITLIPLFTFIISFVIIKKKK